MFIKKSALIIILVLGVLIFCFYKFYKDPELTPEASLWITNNSGSEAKVTVTYHSGACPQTCKLELGSYAVNEGRSTTFPVGSEGDFTITAEINGRTIISENKYVERWNKEYAIIAADKISLK